MPSRSLLYAGIAPPRMALRTVGGRKSGRHRSIPITLVSAHGERWLVAPYGVVSWVKNARAAGEVTLSRGRYRETLRIAEPGPQASAPVLKQYVGDVPITRPFFDAAPDAPASAFEAEAVRHPVSCCSRRRHAVHAPGPR